MHKFFGTSKLTDVNENEEEQAIDTLPSPFDNKKSAYKSLDNKICIGDKVKITTNKLTNVKGTVVYIGYPFPPPRGARYGIDLDKATGEHNGSLFFDIKTEKIITKPRHLAKYKKRIKKRICFKAKSNHGIFVRKNEVSSIERPSTTRFTIEDRVEVRFRGVGTIKFIGSLEHTKEMGIWYGIQLKDRRGRHDGTLNGVKYFQCAPQYGLHARQNHLTLIEHQGNKTISDKKQKGDKWAKILGASGVKGFAIRVSSAVNLTDPQIKNKHHILNPSDTIATTTVNTSVLSLKLGGLTSATSTQNISIPRIGTLGTLASLSNILPADMNFTNNISVHVLTGTDSNGKAVHNVQPSTSASEHASVKRGATIAVLPGYSKIFKKKKFFDHFDFDEIEDQLGEGEFGVVYKCRRVDIEEDEGYDDEYSTTIKTMTKYGYGSTTNTLASKTVYPGDRTNESNSDTDDSLSGSYSSDEDDNEYFAVKKIKKAKFHHLSYQQKQDSIKLLQQEIKLLEKVQHLKKRNMDGSQYIVDLVDVFEDRNYLYIVTNFCGGGPLWSYIEDENHSEQNIQSIMKQILEGLAFLHRHNVAHLDLKPDNIMFNNNNEIQLIDFGMSHMIPPLHKAKVLVGTPNFVAPEVIQGFYDKKADVWSVGIIFFMLRFGYPPFFEGNSRINHDSMDGDEEKQKAEHEKLFDKIKNGFDPSVKPGLGPWFPSNIPVCDELKDLISKMLCSDLAKRLTAAECLAHPYFKTLADPKKLPTTVMDALTKFSGQCQFNVMIARLFAHQIEPDQMKQLRECWDKFDVDDDGSLTLEQFKKVMNEYEHDYKDYQIEAIFESLDWNETDQINFQSLLTAFSYQRLVAVDERLWEAFARLDNDSDGHITKAEIKRVLAIVNPEGFDEGLTKLNQFKPVNNTTDLPNLSSKNLSAKERREKNISVWIGDCMLSADWDDDGQIDYEEFLRALHPRFNEHPVTPKALQSPSEKVTTAKFIFQPSLGTGISYGAQVTPVDENMNFDKDDETNKGAFQTYINNHKVQSDGD